MKRMLLSSAFVFLATLLSAQQKAHKIVFDFTKADTADFSTITRQSKNIMAACPDCKLEIVCYGPGLDLLMKEKTSVQKQIEELNDKLHVVFAACEATMRRRQVDKSQLLPFVVTVPLASLEIASKQEEGWSYMKGGY